MVVTFPFLNQKWICAVAFADETLNFISFKATIPVCLLFSEIFTVKKRHFLQEKKFFFVLKLFNFEPCFRPATSKFWINQGHILVLRRILNKLGCLNIKFEKKNFWIFCALELHSGQLWCAHTIFFYFKWEKNSQRFSKMGILYGSPSEDWR